MTQQTKAKEWEELIVSQAYELKEAWSAQGVIEAEERLRKLFSQTLASAIKEEREGIEEKVKRAKWCETVKGMWRQMGGSEEMISQQEAKRRNKDLDDILQVINEVE